MGGGSSSQADSDQVAKATNYMNDSEIREEANERGVDTALLAYAYQKQGTLDHHDMIQARSQEEKQTALAQQENALQARIDKAAKDMEQAKS